MSDGHVCSHKFLLPAHTSAFAILKKSTNFVVCFRQGGSGCPGCAQYNLLKSTKTPDNLETKIVGMKIPNSRELNSQEYFIAYKLWHLREKLHYGILILYKLYTAV